MSVIERYGDIRRLVLVQLVPQVNREWEEEEEYIYRKGSCAWKQKEKEALYMTGQ